MRKLNKIEREILLYLRDGKMIMSSSRNLYVENLLRQYTRDDLLESCANLAGIDLIHYHGDIRGCSVKIKDAEAFKRINKLLKWRIFFQGCNRYLTRIWIFLWKHLIITVLTSGLTTLLSLYLAGFFEA